MSDAVMVPGDKGPNFSDSTLPEEMIYAGIAVLDQVEADNADYVAGETTDWDQGMVAVAIYRAMTDAGAAMLAASTPVGGWEPIDALPEAMKDGVARFLVSYTDEVVRACRWLDNSKTDWPWKGVSPTEQIPMRADARMTHWMPLPPPPSVSIDTGDHIGETNEMIEGVAAWDREICTGCTSSLSIADIKARGVVSCCPDRHMVRIGDLVDAYTARPPRILPQTEKGS